MPVKKKIQYKDYQDYLNSPAWKKIKEDYKKNNDHLYCAFCENDTGLQHHHWRYPKDWNDATFFHSVDGIGLFLGGE